MRVVNKTHTHITKFNKLGNKYKVQNSPNKPRLLYLVSKIRCPVSLHCWPLAVFKNLLFLGYSGYLFLSTENTIINEMLNAQGKTKTSHHSVNCYPGVVWVAIDRSNSPFVDLNLVWNLLNRDCNENYQFKV